MEMKMLGLEVVVERERERGKKKEKKIRHVVEISNGDTKLEEHNKETILTMQLEMSAAATRLAQNSCQSTELHPPALIYQHSTTSVECTRPNQ
jgi:hypothetical protein